MFRAATILAIVWITAALLYQAHFVAPGEVGQRRPAPAAPPESPISSERRPLPPQEPPRASPRAPTAPPTVQSESPLQGPPELNEIANVEMDPCAGNCAGSAFALASGPGREGLWMTARHVVGDCKRVVVLAGELLEVSDVLLHPRADLALIRTGRSAPVLSLGQVGQRSGEDGFGFGFPDSTPGEAHGQLLGSLRMRTTGSVRYVAPVIAWAEVSRNPAGLAALQGISGGPLLDSAGRVIGVMIATSKRRGRFYSAAPASLDELIAWSGVPVRRGRGGSAPPIGARSYPGHGDGLRAKATVAQVGCLQRVRSGQRRPPVYRFAPEGS